MDEATAIIKAAERSGWEAMMVAATLICCIGFLVWLVKAWREEATAREKRIVQEGLDREGKTTTEMLEREKRLAARIDKLEDFVMNDLRVLAVQCKEALDHNSVSNEALTQALAKNPCFWSEEKQAEIMADVVERLKTA